MKRKVHQPKVYDKERTKKQLVAAVGRLLMTEGFQNIRINKIEKTAGVSKKLIYQYFGGLDGLIKAYLLHIDFWQQEKEKYEEILSASLKPLEKETMSLLLRQNFEYLQANPEMQKIILWGISARNKTIKNLADEREAFGNRVFESSDLVFQNTDIDFRAVAGILVSAIYYIVLHSKMIDSPICGIDASKKEGRERFMNMIDKLLELCYRYKK